MILIHPATNNTENTEGTNSSIKDDTLQDVDVLDGSGETSSEIEEKHKRSRYLGFVIADLDERVFP